MPLQLQGDGGEGESSAVHEGFPFSKISDLYRTDGSPVLRGRYTVKAWRVAEMEPGEPEISLSGFTESVYKVGRSSLAKFLNRPLLTDF